MSEIRTNMPSLSVERTITTLTRAYTSVIEKGLSTKILPSVMMWGPPGVGKSQAVRAIAKDIEKKTGKTVKITDVRLLLFNPIDNRLVGWTNIQTGEVKSPYPNLRVEDCRMYAFAGIHLFSPSLLPLMESWPTRFSIIDFYLSIADKVPIIGVPKSDLQLIDVGKSDTLHQVPREVLG